jgi:hypothetical protein
MFGERIELLIEFGVILLSPVVHTYYLWKVKRVSVSVIRQNIKIFSVLYALIAFAFIILVFK